MAVPITALGRHVPRVDQAQAPLGSPVSGSVSDPAFMIAPMTPKKDSRSFVPVDPAQLDPAVAKLLTSPPVPIGLARLFVDQALNHVAESFIKMDKTPTIKKAEVVFPGPFMRVVTKRRSFYFRWDENHADAEEIDRHQFPTAAAVSRSVTAIAADDGNHGIEPIRQMLLGRLWPEATH